MTSSFFWGDFSIKNEGSDKCPKMNHYRTIVFKTLKGKEKSNVSFAFFLSFLRSCVQNIFFQFLSFLHCKKLDTKQGYKKSSFIAKTLFSRLTHTPPPSPSITANMKEGRLKIQSTNSTSLKLLQKCWIFLIFCIFWSLR